MKGLFGRLFHKRDTEADERLEREVTENERKRIEMRNRLRVIEASLPVRQQRRNNAS